MKKIVTAAEMREVDRLTTELYATPSLLLMEAAAGAAARVIASHFSHDLSGRRVQILCGRGNNGGDGAALARALLTAGARVDLVLFGRAEDSRGDARTNFDIVRGLAGAGGTASPSSLAFSQCEGAAEWESLANSHGNYEVVVDALFGTGL
ncbi:MAG TPA: NAD(P)H-hydrate epimerase, partial [Pyrinomonadaceae bacterium]|nr:NAD(P)H-hydrate epimerase [Pyrinomonadaceae bacterium]